MPGYARSAIWSLVAEGCAGLTGSQGWLQQGQSCAGATGSGKSTKERVVSLGTSLTVTSAAESEFANNLGSQPTMATKADTWQGLDSRVRTPSQASLRVLGVLCGVAAWSCTLDTRRYYPQQLYVSIPSPGVSLCQHHGQHEQDSRVFTCAESNVHVHPH